MSLGHIARWATRRPAISGSPTLKPGISKLDRSVSWEEVNRKGDYNRAKKSARRVGRVTGHFPCENYEDSIDWEDAIDDAYSFRKEHERLDADGGPGRGNGNHNKIWGPGRWLR